MRKLLILVALLLTTQVAYSKDLYLAQMQAGSSDGSSCANAIAASFFNSSGNWGAGAGKISPGDTVHLCGTISTKLTFQASGTMGNVITLLFETGAKMSAPTWGTGSTGQAILIPDGTAYVAVNGGTACGWINRVEVACNGTIEATNNGSSPTYATSDDTGGIFCRYCSNVTIQNMAVINLFVKNDTGGQGGGDAIHIDGTGITLKNNVAHDASLCISSGRNSNTTSANLEIANNIAYHCNWTYRSVDNGSNGVLNGFLFHDNEAYDWQNWDDLVTNNFHHNGIIVDLNNSGSAINGMQLYRNYFHGNTGTKMTGEIFLDCNDFSAGCYTGTTIYNNVFQVSANGPSNGSVTMGGFAFAAAIYNNTFYNTSNFGANCVRFSSVVVTSKNNIFYNCGTVYSDPAGSLSASDYNDFNGQSGIGPSAGANPTLAGWQGATGFDTHGISIVPNINSTTYIPNDSTLTVGVNLSSLGITALNSDAASNPRPSATAWTIGAFNGGSTSPSGPPPNPLIVQNSSLPVSMVGQPYSVSLTANGGTPPYSWSVSPPFTIGLQLSASGVLSGTPNQAVTNTYTFTVKDSTGVIASVTLLLTVSPASGGIPGPQGPAGPIGPTGLTGPQGTPGKTPATMSCIKVTNTKYTCTVLTYK